MSKDQSERETAAPAPSAVPAQWRPATVHQVARLAGVSTATINRVVQARGYVAASTRARVEEALRLTGYRPNAVAKGLRSQRSFTIGHVVTAIDSNPFFVKVARSLEEEALRHGFKTFIFNHNGSSDRERMGLERLADRRVDAIVFTDALEEANVEFVLTAGIPVVQVERIVHPRTASVTVDNARGAAEAVRHLLDLGHRRIAFIGGDPNAPGPDRSVEVDRFDAYEREIAGRGWMVDPALVRFGPYYDGEGSPRFGAEHTEALLRLSEPPTAIFATCDILAAGVLQSLHRAHLRVPDDISVVGFDDTLAASLSPPLTTVAQPMRQLGAEAFRLARAAIEGDGAPSKVRLTTGLRHRSSTAAPASAR